MFNEIDSPELHPYGKMISQHYCSEHHQQTEAHIHQDFRPQMSADQLYSYRQCFTGISDPLRVRTSKPTLQNVAADAESRVKLVIRMAVSVNRMN